jgi:hypothetical protein
MFEKRFSSGLLLLVFSPAVLAFGACEPDNRLCQPTQTQSCPCGGGINGVQACAPGGKSWGDCNCGRPDGGAPDAGPDDGGDVSDSGSDDGQMDSGDDGSLDGAGDGAVDASGDAGTDGGEDGDGGSDGSLDGGTADGG